MNDTERHQLLVWSETLAGVARTGLAFTASSYEQERFTEVLSVAADIRAKAAGDELTSEEILEQWTATVGKALAGYTTPKIGIGAVVGNDKNQLLLIQRSDSGAWLYPTGWADVGYSASEVAVKEVKEETGIECEPMQVIAVLDGLRLGFNAVPLYSIVFQCRATGGSLQAHPHECLDAGWFGRENLPSPLLGGDRWISDAFDAIEGKPVTVKYDLPRNLAAY